MANEVTINFGVANVSTIYSANAGFIDLSTNHGLKLPSANKPFFAVWWNYTDYPDATDDPNKEVVKVYKKTNDRLYIKRGSQGTVPSDKNLIGKTYRIAQFFDEENFNKRLSYFKNPNLTSYYFNDFEHASPATNTIDSLLSISTSTTTTAIASELNHSGIIEFSSGSGGTNAKILGLGASNILKFLQYDMEMALWFYFPFLIGQNSKQFNFAAGFGNGTTNTTLSLPIGGALFTYANNNGVGTSGPHFWSFVIRDNSVTIINDRLSVPVKANTWYELRIKTYKEDICDIYINKTFIKRYVGKLPKAGTGNAPLVTAEFGIGQQGGQGEVRVDAFEFKANFRNERTASVLNS